MQEEFVLLSAMETRACSNSRTEYIKIIMQQILNEKRMLTWKILNVIQTIAGKFPIAQDSCLLVIFTQMTLFFIANMLANMLLHIKNYIK